MNKKILIILCCILAMIIGVNSAFADVGGVAKTGNNTFNSFPITGDGPTDMIACAAAQLGRTTSSLGYTGGWCAAFVVDCAYLTGQADAIPFISGQTHGVSGLYNAVLNRGGVVVSTPQKGDLVFYGNSHVAIMADSVNAYNGNLCSCGDTDCTYYVNCRVQYINKNNYRGGSGITGYLRPNYKNAAPTGTLDINGLLDGKNSGSLENYGTVDVYITRPGKSEMLLGENVSDFNKSYEAGTTYRITNIKAKDGYAYDGLSSGSLTGTISANTTTNVRLKFNSCILDVKGRLDGTVSDNVSPYATFDVYIGGTLKASGVNDFNQRVTNGAFYEITNIQSENGYEFNESGSGSLTGTIGSGTKTVTLDFNFDPTPNADWKVVNTLPSGVTTENCYIEYSAQSTQVAVDSPGDGWVKTGIDRTEYVPTGEIKEFDLQQTETATLKYKDFYYFHYCNASSGKWDNLAEHFAKGNLTHRCQVDAENFDAVAKQDVDYPEYTYYNLTWKQPNPNNWTTAWCAHNNAYAFYRMYRYDVYKAVTYYRWTKATGWQETQPSGTILQFRYRLKAQTETITIMNANGVVVNDTARTLKSSNVYQLSATVSPSVASQTVTWTSSNTAIATITSAGKLTFTQANKWVLVTCTATDGSGVTASFKIRYRPLVKSITIKNSSGAVVNDTARTLKSSNVYQLTATASPASASQAVTWTSSNTDVATITSAGKMTFKQANRWIIVTAAATDGSGVTASFKIKCQPLVKSITIKNYSGAVVNDTIRTLKSSNVYQLTAAVSPALASEVVTWTSSNTAVATITAAGKMTFKQANKWVLVTCAATDGSGVEASFKIKYQPSTVQTTSITIKNTSGAVVNDTIRSLKSSNVYQLTATALPADASQSFTWSVSDTAVATITSAGKMTFKQTGKQVTVTCAATDGSGVKASFKVTYRPVLTTGLTIKNSAGTVVSGTMVTLKSTNVYQLSAATTPAEASKLLTWQSTNTSVATVTSGGKVTFTKAGTVTIMVMTTDGSDIFASVMIKYAPTAAGTASNGADVLIEKLDPNQMDPYGIRLTDGDFNLELDDVRPLIYEDPEGRDFFFGSFDETLLAIDRESGMMTPKDLGTTTVFVSTVDPMEIKAMANVTIIAPLPEKAEVISETDEVNELFGEVESYEEPIDETAKADASDMFGEVTEEAAEINIGSDESGVTEAADESPEIGLPEVEESLEWGTAEEAVTTEPEQIEDVKEPLTIELDIPETELSGEEGTELKLARDAFLNTDEELAAVKFHVADEWAAKIDPEADVAADGLKISLLAAGETTLTAELPDGTKVFEIRLIITTAPAVDEASSAETETEEMVIQDLFDEAAGVPLEEESIEFSDLF